MLLEINEEENAMKSKNPMSGSEWFRLVFALFLIGVGLYLIVRNIPIHPQIALYFFPVLMILLGFYWLTEFFLFPRKGILMPGLMFCALGGFMILVRWQLLPPLSISWPLLLACVGAVLWVHALSEALPLWPLTLMVVAGILLYVSGMPWFSLQSVLRLWPVLLVLLGILLIFRPRHKSGSRNIENQE
jgi:hypothetical protein